MLYISNSCKKKDSYAWFQQTVLSFYENHHITQHISCKYRLYASGLGGHSLTRRFGVGLGHFVTDVFNLRSWPRVELLYSVSFSTCIETRIAWLLFSEESCLTHWFSLEIHVRWIERRAKVWVHLFNIRTVEGMNRTSDQSQVKLSLLRSISLNIGCFINHYA
jgi:hypothetical protein